MTAPAAIFLTDLIEAAARVAPKMAPTPHVCRECKYWDEKGGAQIDKSMRLCVSDGIAGIMRGNGADEVWTPPDFGCVYWEGWEALL